MDNNGKRQRRKVTGKTEAEARRKLHKLTEKKQRGEITTSSRHTLEWLIAQWLATKTNREANTYGGYERYTRLWVIPQLGKLTLKKLDTREAKTLIQAWVVASPKLAALVVTEINPDHDPDGLLIRRFVKGFATALQPLAAQAARR